MIRIERTLPGELEGDIDPEDYGFDVITEEPPSRQERTERVGRLYAQAKERTGVVIPSLEPYLVAVSEEPSSDSDSSVDTEGHHDTTDE